MSRFSSSPSPMPTSSQQRRISTSSHVLFVCPTCPTVPCMAPNPILPIRGVGPISHLQQRDTLASALKTLPLPALYESIFPSIFTHMLHLYSWNQQTRTQRKERGGERTHVPSAVVGKVCVNATVFTVVTPPTVTSELRFDTTGYCEAASVAGGAPPPWASCFFSSCGCSPWEAFALEEIERNSRREDTRQSCILMVS